MATAGIRGVNRIELPAEEHPEKQQVMAQLLWSLPSPWETENEFQALSLGLIQHHSCTRLESEQNRRCFLLLYLSNKLVKIKAFPHTYEQSKFLFFLEGANV